MNFKAPTTKMTSYTYKRSSTLCVSKTVSKLCMCISERNAAHSLLCRDPVPALQSCWVLTRGSVVRLSTFPVCWTPRLQTDGQQLCTGSFSLRCVTVAVTLRVQCWTDINFCAEYNRGTCTSLKESTLTWWNSVMATLTTRLKCWKASGKYMTIAKHIMVNCIIRFSFQAIAG